MNQVIQTNTESAANFVTTAATKTITRKEACPKCQENMTMEANIEDGYSRELYLCRCGFQAWHEGNDWVGAPDTICDIQFCGKKIDDISSLCEEHEQLRQEAEEAAN